MLGVLRGRHIKQRNFEEGVGVMAVLDWLIITLFGARAVCRLYRALAVEEKSNERIAQFIAAVIEGGLVWWAITVTVGRV